MNEERRRDLFYDAVIIYFGLISLVGTFTETTWWKWVFAVLSIYFFGWATYRIQKREGIK